MEDRQPKPIRRVRVHPASPASLIQEIPTPDVVHTANEPLRDAHILQEQGRGAIPSDVLGSYTGTPETGDRPDQDADDL